MRKLLLATTAITLLAACDNQGTTETTKPATKAPAETVQVASAEAEEARLNEFLDAIWEEGVAMSPEYQTYLGRKTNMDKWNDRSEAGAQKQRELNERALREIREKFDRETLTEEGKLSYDLFVYSRENSLRLDNFRDSGFAFSQFRGVHSGIPVTLANYHNVTSVEDAEAYVKRVATIHETLGQAVKVFEDRAVAGNTLPEFSFPLIASSARNVITGAPFDDSDKESPIYADFKRKMEALEADEDVKAGMLAEVEQHLIESVKPAYEDFAARVLKVGESVEGNYGLAGATGDQRKEYYNALLASYTTTDMTADEVHELGLSEVARIHGEMQAIMDQVGFEGSLQDFFDFMRTSEQFYKPNTDEGREEYLELARGYIREMDKKLPELFNVQPKSPVEVRRVESFRERAAGKAFYTQPAPDGSRPGIFYANLLRMEDMPTYQLEALVYHEAAPGHHMQRALQIEKQGLPKFRQFGGYTAYTEGWGLYSEILGKDVGFYQDPYSDFGRLAMELWRAARLVVDTGLHAKGWEMQTAIDYLKDNTPNPEGDCIKAIERYIVLPGQATAYKIGMNKILELRQQAFAELGDKFSIRDFHSVVIESGPVPLAVLEARVNDYIAATKAS
jgi:uncharacterized protein (DUF885 family)